VGAARAVLPVRMGANGLGARRPEESEEKEEPRGSGAQWPSQKKPTREERGAPDESKGPDRAALNGEESGMEVRRKGGAQYRRECDRLPFDVRVSSPPPRYLGRFHLDALTHGGDILEHDGQSYVVKSVVFHYALQNGKFVVHRKTAHVKSLARKSIDSYLNKLYKSS